MQFGGRGDIPQIIGRKALPPVAEARGPAFQTRSKDGQGLQVAGDHVRSLLIVSPVEEQQTPQIDE